MNGGDDAGTAPVRMTAWVRGRVQRVGFRWWTRARALELGGLTGYASNLGDGRVQVVAEGSQECCERLLDLLRDGDAPGRVDGVTEIWTPADASHGSYDGFAIR
jgi:acylphosphatase